MRHLRILVTDDETIIRLGLRRTLIGLGHEVRMAADGREALKLGAQESFDVAILDVRMPGMDGLETARALYQQQPTAILMLTAVNDVEIIERAATIPIQGYLLKPVVEEQLLASIEVAWQRFRDSRTSDLRTTELETALQTRELVEQAKVLLMNKGYTHTEAERQLLRLARDKQIPLQKAAEFVLGQDGSI